MTICPGSARLLSAAALLSATACAPASPINQPSGAGALRAADSSLVGRILLAEDRRDSTDAALHDGERHPDARVRVLVQRARGRIRDSLYATRDSLPPVAAPPTWPEPAWKARYRSLAPRRDDCIAVREALADAVWMVRLRAAAVVRQSCASDDAIASALRSWVAALPADASRRLPGEASWHGAAHGIVALARLRPTEARPLLGRLATHPQWQARMYAARAAALASDTARLRALARDANDNVREAAIDALARLTGHADDSLYIAALDASGAQVVRAAAIALKGSPRPDARAAARAAHARWAQRRNQSERDARVALLEAAGLAPSQDQAPTFAAELPPKAVALALGADARVRVTMAPEFGGRSFVVRMRGDVAPVMAARVLALASRGYYDNTAWHRAEHDFVLQGLGPGNNEYVGHARFFRDELGTIAHPRGTIGMSTRGHDSGDAQWFINLRDNPRLIRDFTVFAEVVEGMDVVDDIMEGDVVARIEVLPR